MHKIVNGVQVELTGQEIAELEEKEKAYAERRAKQQLTAYREVRAKAYPDIGDQLDAILKQLNYMQMKGETDLIHELDGVVAAWLRVKRNHPKPEDQ